jgi:hypothetical protein
VQRCRGEEGDACSAVFDHGFIDRDQRDHQKKEPLHHAPDPDAAGSKKPYSKNLHAILLVLYIVCSAIIFGSLKIAMK